VARFLDSVSGNPHEMSEELRRRDNGPNDVTVFRMFPLVQQYYNLHLRTAWFGLLMMDNRFLLEKALAGPYWRASGVVGQRLREFWGLVFEPYVNELLAESCAATDSTFIADPRCADNPATQICDGIVVSGNSIVLVEYKSSMFRADTKYGGDHRALADEIENKLVHDREANERKGVEQLAEAISLLFTRGSNRAIRGTDLTNVRRVYPYIVTLDPLGATLGMSAFLNTYFADLLVGTSFAVEVAPLFCSSVADLEDKTGYFAAHPLPRILEAWLNVDPQLIGTLGAVSIPPRDWRGNEWLAAQWELIFREMTAILYPGFDPGPGMAEAVRLRRARAAQ
jgi:hypothetical protein